MRRENTASKFPSVFGVVCFFASVTVNGGTDIVDLAISLGTLFGLGLGVGVLALGLLFLFELFNGVEAIS